MRILCPLAVVAVLGTLLGSSRAAALPEVRPAVIFPGPRALVNLINGEGLMKRGQKDGLVMFDLVVTKLGTPGIPYTYRGTPGSDLLADEVLGHIERSTWLPAVKGRTPKSVVVFGTVVFAIVEGKPRVRVYLNQEENELLRQNDFVAPQLVLGPGQKFKVDWPPQAGSRNGTTATALDVDTGGRVQAAKLTYESPTGLGFGSEATRTIREAEFIPAFRNGQPVSSRFTMPLFFRAGIGWKWGT